MYASDYPHWDFDDAAAVRLPAAWREAVMDGNARALYTRLPGGGGSCG